MAEQQQVADLQQELIAARQQHTAVVTRLQAAQSEHEETLQQVGNKGLLYSVVIHAQCSLPSQYTNTVMKTDSRTMNILRCCSCLCAWNGVE